MAIVAVNNVSFRNNYNQLNNTVNFEGKKKEKSGLHIPMSVKAIPLATMLAMSPLNEASKAFAIKPTYSMVATGNVVPLPANCRILNQVKIDCGVGQFKTFNLISVDGNNGNYEFVEEIAGVGERVTSRGIVKAITMYNDKDNKKNIVIHSIRLDENNLENYAPQKGIDIKLEIGENYWNLYKILLDDYANNGAVRYISPKASYVGLYDNDLQKYKNALDID